MDDRTIYFPWDVSYAYKMFMKLTTDLYGRSSFTIFFMGLVSFRGYYFFLFLFFSNRIFYLSCVTYGRGQISQCTLTTLDRSMQAMDDRTIYFPWDVSYAYKMFMKLTTELYGRSSFTIFFMGLVSFRGYYFFFLFIFCFRIFYLLPTQNCNVETAERKTNF